ncbi:MAG: MFS transporter [Candidatus Sericytochromatia bacterium]|nr:MFS transporter [Candidatus Sericytochromatia bacterium]
MAEAPAPAPGAVHAWALYDFATTAFYMNFMSTYFALWVVKDQQGTDLAYGWAKSGSMLVVALLSPALGAWSDRLGRTRPFLLAFTGLFLAGGLALGQVSGLAAGLVIFGLANVGLQLASVFYNAMLPAVAPPDRLGRVSGYGRAVGYVGSLAAVLVGMAFATGQLFGHPVPGLGAGGNQAVFVPTALLAAAAALPLLWLRERPRGPLIPHHPSSSLTRTFSAWEQGATGLRLHRVKPDPALLSLREQMAAGRVRGYRGRRREPGAVPPPAHGALSPAHWFALVRELWTDPRLRGAGLFLLSGFLFFDTINTIRDFMSIYLVKVVGLSETAGSLQRFLLVVVTCSLVGALGFGWLADRLSPRKALLTVLGLLGAGFAAMVVVREQAWVLGAIGPVLGLAFGGVLVTARPLLARLVPAERRGEFFGLFVLANDFAAILGPLTWGLIVQGLAGHGVLAYQAALAAQLGFLALGFLVLLRVPEGDVNAPAG